MEDELRNRNLNKNAKEKLKRDEKLAINLRKSIKKDLINSKRKLLEEVSLRDEDLREGSIDLGRNVPQEEL